MVSSVTTLLLTISASDLFSSFNVAASGFGRVSQASSTFPPTNSMIWMTFLMRSISEITGICLGRASWSAWNERRSENDKYSWPFTSSLAFRNLIWMNSGWGLGNVLKLSSPSFGNFSWRLLRGSIETCWQILKGLKKSKTLLMSKLPVLQRTLAARRRRESEISNASCYQVYKKNFQSTKKRRLVLTENLFRWSLQRH